VANADGTRRDNGDLSAGQSITGWLRASRFSSARAKCSAPSHHRDRRWALADRRDAAESLMDPSWSPDEPVHDGLLGAASDVELRILNADGSGRRALPLPRNFATAAAWSPDAIGLRKPGYTENMPPHVAAIEVATGRRLALHDFGDRSGMSVRWQPDSRESFRPKHSTRRTRIAA